MTNFVRVQQATIRKRALKLLDRCDYCGEDTKEILQMHHIIPVSKGGNNNFDNIVILCPNCHTKAHKGIISEAELKEVASLAVYKEVCKTKTKSKQTLITDREREEKCRQFELFIKSKLAEKGYDISFLAKLFDTSVPAISQRLRRGKLKYDELVTIADSLGYKIEWIKKV